jgi:hypothetical protein
VKVEKSGKRTIGGVVEAGVEVIQQVSWEVIPSFVVGITW